MTINNLISAVQKIYNQGDVLLHDLFGWQEKSRSLKSCDAQTLCDAGFPAPSPGRAPERITAGGGNTGHP